MLREQKMTGTSRSALLVYGLCNPDDILYGVGLLVTLGLRMEFVMFPHYMYISLNGFGTKHLFMFYSQWLKNMPFLTIDFQLHPLS